MFKHCTLTWRELPIPKREFCRKIKMYREFWLNYGVFYSEKRIL